MTPGARLAAAIEVLDRIAASRTPADELLKAWGKAHRFAGAKDRRAIAERVFAALRAQARAAWRMQADGGRALVLGSLVEADGLAVGEIAGLANGEGHAPTPLTEQEQAFLSGQPSPPPDWVLAGAPDFAVRYFKTAFGEAWLDEARALIGARAPLDLRVNTLRGGIEGAVRLLAVDGLEPARTPLSALGLRLPAELAPDVARLRAYADGWVEVQDEASQVAAALAGARPGWTVVDYCAGGGGKTLAFAAALHPPQDGGRLVACDLNARRLDAIAPRLSRAGATAEIRRLGRGGEGVEDLEGQADLVFVDAPCSGSGTWRRHPEGVWRLTPDAVDRLAALQAAILVRAARLVKPGGRLAYATCSVLPPENAAVAEGFAAAHPGFRPLPVARAAETARLTDAAPTRLGELAAGGHMLQLTPRRSGTDGFFLALFERTA